MKVLLTIIRWLTGLLFIFSGLVKANDPLGLSYKMQEFFEVWQWNAFHSYTLSFSLVMNVLEVGAGVALIAGWRRKAVNWLLLLLIVFFTFLTGYALLSGKIKTCGCFGDCLPLTPAQSFGKDLVLLLLILVLFFSDRTGRSSKAAGWLLSITILCTTAMQFYVLKHLPFVDCLPYKVGNDITEQMKTPAGAIPDSISIVFKYRKKGRDIVFDQEHFPEDFDSTYQYIGREDKIIRKGNGLTAAVTDFALQTSGGTDTTAALLASAGQYILAMAKDMNDVKDWKTSLEVVNSKALLNRIPLFLVTAEPEKAAALFPNLVILKCDAIVLKTAARVRPTFLLMKGAVVTKKLAYPDADKIL
jgi:uncharacterized membrane protein YphA (DoxX/SURF4 family)